MLPDSNVNEPASHGFIKYSIKKYNTVGIGSVIKNTAYIYFDFNAPVVTNTVVNTVTDFITSSPSQPQSPPTPQGGSAGSRRAWPG